VLRQVAEIPLPGPAVRLDYQSLDTTSNRLYISHMEAGEMIVFDVKGQRVAATVGGLPRVTGVCAVPELGKVYASVTERDDVAVIDARRETVVARLGRIGFPDGIAYAPDVNKIYVSDEAGGGELVIDGVKDRVVATIPLGGEAGNTIYDPGSHRVLVAVQTRNEIAVIDPATDRVVARHRLPGASHPHGLALDVTGRLLFVANQDNGTVMTVDLHTMRVTGSERVGESPDVLAFDPGWRLLYVACESGAVTVFAETEGGLTSVGEIHMPHAHTVAVDPRTHLVYLPLQDVRGRPVLRIMERPPAGH
jgi:DNA-binding beta-propeller fold protein YncE